MDRDGPAEHCVSSITEWGDQRISAHVNSPGGPEDEHRLEYIVMYIKREV
jgi:hypothetical protein